MKHVLRRIVLLALPVALPMAMPAGELVAQVQAKSFSVVTRVGALKAERAASLEPAGLIGLDTEYSLTNWFGIGTAIDVARGNTTREDFLARLRYGSPSVGGGDSIFYQYLGQPVNSVNITALGVVRYPSKRVSPFLMGGVGSYVLLLDTQVSGSAERKTGLSYTVGGGVWVKLTERTGLQLDARAVTYTKYDRAFLDPSEGRFPNYSFPQDFPQPPPAKNTALNTMLTLGFRYIPGAAGGGN